MLSLLPACLGLQELRSLVTPLLLQTAKSNDEFRAHHSFTKMTRSSATAGGPRDAMSLSAATTFTTSQEQIKIMELEAVAPPGFRNRRGQ